jgi:ABC-type branched-subunit amino acid transport system substrate-binding protein
LNKKIIIPVIIIIFSISISFTQSHILQKEKQILERNISLYKEGKFDNAYESVSLIIERLPKNSFLTTYQLLLAKICYKRKKYQEAIDISDNFIKRFPKSTYCDDILYNTGNCYYRLALFDNAVKTWINAIECSDDYKLKNKLAELINTTLIHRIDQERFESFESEASSEDGKMLIRIANAEYNFRKGDFVTASEILNKALVKYTNTQFTSNAKTLLSMINGKRLNVLRFALLLPLTGSNGDLSNQIKEGVEYAIKEYNNKNEVKIELVIKDYGEEIFDAIRITRELAQDKSIIAVLGPIENEISVACAPISGYENLPMINPTATRDNLTDLSEYLFQLNCPISIQANKIARYALDSLKIMKYAVISPMDDSHFIRMVAKFIEAIKDNRGEIVAEEWYYSGEQDFNKYFMNIKRKGLKCAFRDSLLNSDPLLSANHIDSLYNKYMQLKRQEMLETGTTVDSADIPVNSIGGFFIPIYKEDFKLIAPQIAYSNIQAQFFGNNDWYEMDLLNKNKKFINGIIFTTDGFIDENNWDYRKFRNDYRTKLSKTPTIYNLIGFDSMDFMLKVLENTKDYIPREKYYYNLKKIKKHIGIYRTVILNNNRFNQNPQLLKYLHGQIIPLN